MKRYLAISLMLASFSAYGALHKWVDAEGVVHYSDVAPSKEIKAETIKSSSTATDNVTGSSGVAAPKTLSEREADVKRAEKAKSEANEKAAREQEIAAIKKKNCENARTNLTTLENAPRLVTYDAQGEQSFLSDEQRKQRIEDARKAISTNCN